MTESEYAHDDVPRRSFVMRAVTSLVAGIVGIVPLIAGGGFLLDPLLRRNRQQEGDDSADGFLPLTIGPDALPDDGTPLAVTVVSDRIDAWNYYEQQPVGSVWLRKTESDELIAFNTICPHLGCSVDYRTAHADFFCPCHLSHFNLKGERQNQIPPRDMDSLELRVADGKIWVKFQNYRGGIPEKTVV